MRLKGKCIVISGGTSGIGRELVAQLYRDNRLIVVARNEEKLGRLTSELPGITVLQADLAVSSDVEAVADAIIKRFGSIDLLINNAAVQYTPTFLDDEFRYETIAREIALNLTSVCSLSYLLLPALLHREEAAILNVNSGLALAPKTTSAVYCASKGGLNIFSQSLRYQLEHTNIRVLQVFLDLVDTPMTQGRGKHKMPPSAAAQRIIRGVERNIPNNNIGKVGLLRLLLRLSPTLARRILKKY
ncbi:MAG: SDR family NAD(P)-dependent oxidoreductase [Candidatus Thiodiazotropha sp. (ex Monitilora ramsayi)]|nr:SDR family NAD(P)-dependent oxidoreductase [Candidatus Thiodiazotropha sp. (ex Monitilora ramsayi)]